MQPPRIDTPSAAPLKIEPIFNPSEPEIIRIQSGQSKFYKIKDFNIYAHSPEDCQKIYKLYESLSERGEFGHLVQKHMKQVLCSGLDEFAIFGWPGSSLPVCNAPAVYAFESCDPYYKKIGYPGITPKTGIILALEHNFARLRINFAHESVHFFVGRINPETPKIPFAHLSENAATKFMELFEREKHRFSKNPFIKGSRDWNIHNYMHKWIFNAFLAYPNAEHLSEITSYTLQLELAFEGGMLRKFSPALADSFHDILKLDQHPISRISTEVPRPSVFVSQNPSAEIPGGFYKRGNLLLPDYIQTIPLEELHTSSIKTPFNIFLKSIGDSTKAALKKCLNTGRKGLEVLGRPEIAVPVHIILAYEKGQEAAHLKAIANGVGAFALGAAMYQTIGFIGGPAAVIVVGVGSVAAEILPDLQSIEKRLPTEDELKSIGQYSPELEVLLRGDGVKSYRDLLKVSGYLQNGFKMMNPAHIWNRYMKERVDSKIDEITVRRDFKEIIAHAEENPSEFEKKMAKFEEILSMDFDEYLKKYPYSENSNDLLQTKNPTNALGSSFLKPNVNTLEPVTSPSLPIGVNLNNLNQCELTWSVSENANLNVTTLQTSMEIASNEIAEIQNSPIEMTSSELKAEDNHSPRNLDERPRHILLHEIKTEPEEKPRFSELLQITSVRMGEGIGGGQGLIFTTKGGGEFSLSTTGSAILTGVRAPLTNNFFTALGTGFVYHLPIAAAIFVIGKLFDSSDKKYAEKLKSEAKKGQKEGEKLNQSLNMFDTFCDQFFNGKIDKDAFKEQINDISTKLERAKGRGIFDKTRLRQIDLDLKKLTEEAFIRREVKESFVPMIHNKPLKELVDSLLVHSNKRVLSIQEKYEQDALYNEIIGRVKTESFDALKNMERLENQPFAISFNPNGVAKPHHLNSSAFKNKNDSDQRQAKRVKDWACDLESSYQHFQQACKNGNYQEMERTAGDVLNQIQRTDGKHDINLSHYPIYYEWYEGKKKNAYTNASEYYKNYINAIQSNTLETIKKAKEAKTGTISESNPAIFSNSEIKEWKIHSATNAFNTAVESFNGDHKSPQDKNTAFKSLFEAAKSLHTMEDKDPKVKTILEIGNKYTAYSDYEKATARLESIRKRIQNLQTLTDQMNPKKETDSEEKSDTPEISASEYTRLFKLAFEEAKALKEEEKISEEDVLAISKQNNAKGVLSWIDSLHEDYPKYKSQFDRQMDFKNLMEGMQKTTAEMRKENIKKKDYTKLYKRAYTFANDLLFKGITKDEIEKLVGKSGPEEDVAADLMKWIRSIHEGYPNHLKVERYQDQTLPIISTPITRFALHVLNNSHRYNRPHLNLGVKVIATTHSLFPEFVPQGINYLIASYSQENEAVIHALAEKCRGAIQSNVLSSLKKEVSNPKAFAEKKFSKKVASLQGANTVIQVASTVVSGVTSRYYKDDPQAEKVNEVFHKVSFASNKVSSALQYANFTRKSIKYLKGGTFVSKFHKVSEGALGVAMSGFDLYELLATDASEYGFGKGIIETAQKFFPDYRGNLPESSSYYASKDVLLTGAYGAMSLSANPFMMGLTLYQGSSMVYNICSNRYVDDALSAIMTNLRYFSKQPKTEKNDRATQSSLKKLMHYVGDLKILPGDSLIRMKAKQRGFEGLIANLESERKWLEIINETEIEKSDGFKFKKTHMDICDLISVAITRYNAFLKLMGDKTFAKEHCVKSQEELEQVTDHIKTYFKNLPPKSQENTSKYIENVNACFEEQREKFVTNFCIYYVQGKLDVTAQYALNRFDLVPVEKRTIIHWYLLGIVTRQFFEEKPRLKLLELQLFSFETSIQLLKNKHDRDDELSMFEEDLKRCAMEIMRILQQTMGSSRDYDSKTKLFAPLIEEIMSSPDQRGKEEEES